MVKFFSRLLIVTLMAGPTMASAVSLDDYEGDIDTEAQSECLVLTKDLRLRSRDAKTEGEVSLLQDFLNTRGYLRTEPTGFFSISTFSAVKAFQKEMKLRPTGFVSVLTRKAIEKVSCDGTTTQTVSVTLKSNVTSYTEGDTIIFTAKVTEQDGTPLTPQEGATVSLHQLSADGGINDKDTMSFERRSNSYVLRADDHTTSADAGSWTGFVTVSKNGSHAGTSEKIAYRVIADEPYVSCTDSDGGKDYFSKGETEGMSPSTGKRYSGSDICGTGTTYAVGQLVEHYCDGKYHTNTVYTCPNGCINGACQRTAEPSVRVISPNGGEVWTEGNDYMMRWTPNDKQEPSMPTIDQFIIRDDGKVVIEALARGNSGWDGWTPRELNGKFKLKICQTGTTNCDMSDNYFTIQSSVIPDVRVSLNPASPSSSTYPRGQKNVELAVIDLRAGDQPVRNLEKIQIAMTRDPSKVFARVSVYDGYRLVGSASSFSYNGEYYYAWINAYNVSVPAYGVSQLRLKADISTTAQPGAAFNLGIAGLNFTGQGASTSGLPVYGDIMTVETPAKNLPPFINGIQAPTSLKAGERGTWTINAGDPENRPLKYKVLWGDEYQPVGTYKYLSNIPYSQNATFTHTYTAAGTYTPEFYVQDDIGQEQFVSASIVVKDMNSNLQPILATYALGPTAAKVGEEIAVYGKNIFATTQVRFNGGAVSSSVRPFSTDRIIAFVPQGAQTGPVTVCNGTLCATTKESLTVLKDLPVGAGIDLLEPQGGETWYAGKTYTVRYAIRNIDTQLTPVLVYLEKYDNVFPKTGPNRATLVGTTKNTDHFDFTVVSSGNSWLGAGTDFRIMVCEWPRCTVQDRSERTFTISNTNLPPVIDGLAAPTTLTAGQSGQWTVRAHDPENKQLTYAVAWGDEPLAMKMNGIIMAAPDSMFVQTTTFTHTYATPGTYTPKFFVKDDAGQVQSTSASVTVSASVPVEYKALIWTDKKEYAGGEFMTLFAKVTNAPGDPFTPEEGAEALAYLTGPNGNYGNRLMKYNASTGYYEWKEQTSKIGLGTWSYVVTVRKGITEVAKSDKVSYAVIAPAQNLPPFINGIQAPTSLKAGERGTWTINARDPENRPLKYKVIWGDEYEPAGTYKNLSNIPYSQNAVFTHTYTAAGTYRPEFYVQDEAGQVQSTSASVTVSAVVPNVPPMRVIAPNGYEQWPEGNQYELRWTPTAKQVPSVQFVDVTVVDVNGSTIATLAKDYKNSGFAYWLPSALYGNRIYGKLKIKVCQTGTSNCDLSDDFFAITRAQTNLPPVVDSVVTPVSVSAGITAQWTIKAHDPENKSLTYSVIWGDDPERTSLMSQIVPPYVQTATFTHTYRSAGNYTATFFVKDGDGQVTPTNVSFAVLPYVACRLDQLNGTNITQSTVDVDRESCLSKLCDVYGPANLGQMSSMCVFMGQEIKRYEAQPLKVSSVSFTNAQATYTAGQPIRLSMRALTTSGTEGTPAKGFKVLIIMQSVPSYEVVRVDGESQSKQATFNSSTRNWDVVLTAPSDASKSYTVSATFYCENSSNGCVAADVQKSFVFTIPQPLPKAASAELLDVQPTYTAGQPVKINMRGITTEGAVGSSDKGFNVQARLKSSAVSGTVQVDGEYQAVNANFDASSGNWVITLKTPLDTAPTYTVDAAFYCSTPGRGCTDNQINRTATFTLTSPVMVPTSSN
jgi:peptidoglycan hydrolase-like protein with peptidoglycan-binding domain